MKRDQELLRSLLFEFEANEDWLLIVADTLGSNTQDRVKSGHVRLLVDAGFVAPVANSTYRLTNDGYDYLDAIRSDTIWNKTREGAKSVGGVTLSMMREIAVTYLKQEVAEKLGVSI
ncbi:DUF2513 domain-containing protein [Roseivivax sp. CAU 1753]